MTRAEVWKGIDGSTWYAATHESKRQDDERIAYRPTRHLTCTREFDTHAEALAWAIEMVGLAPCTCRLLPAEYHTTYGSATDPNTMYEPDPECPQHGETPGVADTTTNETRTP